MNTVVDATRDIRDNLRSGWFDSVSSDELRNNTTILDRLSPEQANDVISSLSDTELSHWTDELHDSSFAGIIGTGGLSLDQRRDLFNDLAADLDVKQLGRVYSALGTGERQAELLDAMAGHSCDATKAGLVSRLAGDTTDKPYDIAIGFGTSTTERWDQDAQAVSTLIGSMSQPAVIEQSMASLATPQLEAVMQAGTAPETLSVLRTGGVSRSHSFDVSGITRLIDAVSRSDDSALKARVFELASSQIDAIRATDTMFSPNPGAHDQAGALASAMTDLVKSNTGAVITALEQGNGFDDSRSGNGASSWVAELVRQEDIADIRQLIGQLQAGNDFSAVPAEFLSRFTTNAYGARDFQNASNLGFLVGAMREGINAIDADTQEKVDMVTRIFNTAVGLGSIVVPGSSLLGHAALVVGSSVTRELTDRVVDGLSSGRLGLQDALEQLALPKSVISSDVTNAFGNAIENVERN